MPAVTLITKEDIILALPLDSSWVPISDSMPPMHRSGSRTVLAICSSCGNQYNVRVTRIVNGESKQCKNCYQAKGSSSPHWKGGRDRNMLIVTDEAKNRQHCFYRDVEFPDKRTCPISIPENMTSWKDISWGWDWDHFDPNEKTDNISRLLDGHAEEKLRDELDKCVLTCVSHHRFVTRYPEIKKRFTTPQDKENV